MRKSGTRRGFTVSDRKVVANNRLTKRYKSQTEDISRMLWVEMTMLQPEAMLS